MLTKTFQINLLNSSVILCKLYYYTAFLFISLSPTTLILASIDRLLISSQNVDTRLYSSKRLAYFSVSINTLFWIIYNIHFLVKVSIQQFYPSYFVCYLDISGFYIDFVAYSLAATNLIVCLLMIILCIFAFQNVRHIRAVPRVRRQQIRSMTKKDFQLLRGLFVQDVVYVTFSMVISLHNVYNAVTKYQVRTPLEQAIQSFLNDIFGFLFIIPYWSNFFIFVIISKAFRHELKCTISKIIGKEINPVREEENRQENVGRDNVELNVVSAVVLPA